YPALGLLFVTLLLAYSRGGLLALVCGCAVWFAFVPLRLRGVVVLATSALGGGLVALWTFAQNPLSNDNVPLGDRASAGQALGVGAGSYATVRPRFRRDTLDVRHAHGYVVQTLADMGIVGMAVSLALLAAWLAAAQRTVGLWGARRRAPWTPERIGMATLF